jgi:hypothetical protein
VRLLDDEDPIVGERLRWSWWRPIGWRIEFLHRSGQHSYGWANPSVRP